MGGWVMMRRITAFLILAALFLTLTGCEEKTNLLEGVIFGEGEVVDGSRPNQKYELPDTVTNRNDFQSKEPLLLLAAYSDGDGGTVTVCGVNDEDPRLLIDWNGEQYEYEISFLNTGGFSLQHAMMDVDEDGTQELVIVEHSGTGTGVAVDYLYVLDYFDDVITAYQFPAHLYEVSVSSALTDCINPWTGNVTLKDVTLKTPKFAELQVRLGQQVAYEIGQNGITPGLAWATR